MRWAILLTVGAVTCVGCGGGGPNDAPSLAPIGGTVWFDGKPIPNATLVFYPEKGPPGMGVANELGEFKIKTNGSTGAPLGLCLVTVSDGSPANEEFPPADGNEMELVKKRTLPSKYANKETTDLVVEVTSEGNAALKLELD